MAGSLRLCSPEKLRKGGIGSTELQAGCHMGRQHSFAPNHPSVKMQILALYAFKKKTQTLVILSKRSLRREGSVHFADAETA
jgi:hypothetical protein